MSPSPVPASSRWPAGIAIAAIFLLSGLLQAGRAGRDHRLYPVRRPARAATRLRGGGLCRGGRRHRAGPRFPHPSGGGGARGVRGGHGPSASTMISPIQNQFIHFFKNIAMAGGLLQVVALRWRPAEPRRPPLTSFPRTIPRLPDGFSPSGNFCRPMRRFCRAGPAFPAKRWCNVSRLSFVRGDLRVKPFLAPAEKSRPPVRRYWIASATSGA